MKTIYKYPLLLQYMPNGICDVVMNRAAMVLHVAEQHGNPCLWASVDTDLPTHTRRFQVVGTGYATPDERESTYLGTAHCGPFVWHVFEVPRD